MSSTNVQTNNKIQSAQMNKSQLWAAIKEAGNPNKFNWRTSVLEMRSFYQEFESERIAQAIQIPEIIINTGDGNGDALKQHIMNAPVNSIITVNGRKFTRIENVNALIGQIFHDCHYLEELQYEEAIYNEDVEPMEDDQVYRFGDQNCLISPIQECLYATLEKTESESYIAKLKKMINRVNKLIPQFNKDGATPELIQNLADATESKIVVYEVITQTKRVFKAQKVQRRFKFKFQNVSIDHVELWSGKNEEVVTDNIYEVAEKLNQNNQTYKYQEVNGNLAKINTGLNTYVDTDFKQLVEAENQINDMTRDLTISLKANPAAGLNLILNAIQIAGGKKFGKDVKPETVKHIDIKQSYSQFQSLPERYKHGFAYLTDFRQVSSVDFAIKYNGFYKLQITSTMPAHINAILGNRPYYVLASNIIQYLVDCEVRMKIEGGIYGKHSKQILLNSSAYVEHLGRKAYYTAFSKYGIAKDSVTDNICCSDGKLASIIFHNVGGMARMVPTKNSSFSDYTYAIITEKEQKPQIKTKAHVYAYIVQCQMLNMMLQLEKMQMNKVKLIFGDDIYYQDHKFQKMDIFRQKDENNYAALLKNTSSQYLKIPHYEPYHEFHFGEEESEYHQYQLHQGPGGFGKTYTRLEDKGSINQVYTTLTNKLVTEQRQSKFKPKCYTTEMFMAKFKQFKITATNIIIDEMGLCEDGILKFIKENMPYARVYALGDDLQIAGRRTNPFDKSLYDLVLDETNFKTDHRAKNCPKLQNLKSQIRTAMRNGKTEQEIFVSLVAPNSQKTTIDKWVENYNSKKMIVTCSNQQKDEWVDRLKEKHEKYRVCKTFVHNGLQYCTSDVLEALPAGFDYEKNLKLKAPYIKRQYGFTCHSTQGLSHNNELLVQLPINLDMFQGYCYTAVSRLTKIEDLYTLKYKIVDKN